MSDPDGTSAKPMPATDRPGAGWYVVQLRPGGLARARANLERQGFVVFLPQSRVPRRVVRGRPRGDGMSLRPLFPGYLFVEVEAAGAGYRSINGTYGVTRLVPGPDGQPARLPHDTIAALLARTDEDGVLRPPESFAPGDRVKILTGPFADWIARVEATPERDRVVLLHELLGRTVRINVDRKDLDRA